MFKRAWILFSALMFILAVAVCWFGMQITENNICFRATFGIESNNIAASRTVFETLEWETDAAIHAGENATRGGIGPIGVKRWTTLSRERLARDVKTALDCGFDRSIPSATDYFLNHPHKSAD